MKIVMWNCNGALKNKFEDLSTFEADIYIILECKDSAQSSNQENILKPKQLTKNLVFLFVILSLFIISCSNESNNAELAVASPNDQANQHIARTDSNEKDELFLLSLQLENGNFSQIDSFIKQTEAYLATDSVQIPDEERSGFPRLSKEMMIDFLKETDVEAFSQSRYHEMLYTFNIAPDGYVADSDECPDWIRLSADENTNEYNLLLTSKFLVDQEFGCAESGTVYVFTIEDGKILLKRIDFAG